MTLHAFKLSEIVFIMLINVKMPTIVGIFTNEHDKFQRIDEHEQKFITLGQVFDGSKLVLARSIFVEGQLMIIA